jgi:GTPase SAR1 family protein
MSTDPLAGLKTEERKLPPVVRRLEAAASEGGTPVPVCVIVVGMAGSGKTTLLTQMQRSLDDKIPKKATEKEEENDDEEDDDDNMASYCVNLDPAVLDTPYDVSIDIRDTVDYKQVMEQHRLGPNGAIMTSLNLFSTKFDQVMSILEQRAFPQEFGEETETPSKPSMEYILVDTPGQIEAFTWSASGQIIGESLASGFPTVLCFVVDTVRCAASTNTFMSNMLYACSMLYRTKLPLVVCFNKTDVVSHEFCLEWMRDYETFQAAMDETASTSGFYGSLTRSLSLVLDEFYSNFANAVGVSAVTGEGMEEFWQTVQKAATEDFAVDYIHDLKLRVAEQEARKQAVSRSSVRRLERDLDQDNAGEDEEEEEEE